MFSFGNSEGNLSAMAKKTTRFYLPIILLVVLGLSIDAQAQNQRRIIQLSGVVLGSDSASFIPGVHIYVPKAGRGTTTNSVGFFSMPVLVGDSIAISSVGFQRQHYIVPPSSREFQTIIITMVEDVTFLKEIEIVPFPTEEVFKEAVLAMNMPLDQNIDQKNMNAELLALMLKTTPMDGPQNQRYSLDQWATYPNRNYQPLTNPLLNPFNWAKFFNSMKKKK